MKHPKPLLSAATVLAILLMLGAACASPPPTPPPPQTGVHLQAVFQVPAPAEGVEPTFPEMNYLLYFPAGYGQDLEEEWPLIFFLHGATPSDSASVMSYGLPNVLYLGEQPEPFPFIVVTPQAFTGVPWWGGDTIDILIALLDEVVEMYQVDPDHIYLTGLSMGGYGSWYLATLYPDRFAAMVSVAGSGYHSLRMPPDAMCEMRDIPVWGIHGAADEVSDPDISAMFIEALEECGSDVRWTLYPGANHGETYTRAYREPDLYTWLLEHSRH